MESRPRAPSHRQRSLAVLPATRLGWSSVALAALFGALVPAAGVVPRAAAVGLACGVAGGIAALVAVAREHERALTVLAALVPLAIGVGFVVAELVGV